MVSCRVAYRANPSPLRHFILIEYTRSHLVDIDVTHFVPYKSAVLPAASTDGVGMKHVEHSADSTSPAHVNRDQQLVLLAFSAHVSPQPSASEWGRAGASKREQARRGIAQEGCACFAVHTAQ